MDLAGTRFSSYLVIFLATAVLMAGAALPLGPNLGTFLAGLVVCVLLLPYASSAPRGLGRDLLAAACVTDAIALVWLVLAIGSEAVSLLDWLEAYVLLLSLALFQFGLMGAFRELRISALSAGGISILILLVWLAAPVWLLHHLQTPALLPWMQRIIDVHPLFAMNGAVPLGVWTESPLAYRILNLNQDVYYTLPAGPWMSALVHALIGALLTWINYRRLSRRYK